MMTDRTKGFGLVELMISLVLASIVVVGLYQYFIKGTKSMSDVIIKTGIENMTIRAFNSIISDLKLIGHNPEEIINAAVNPSVDPDNGFLNVAADNAMGISLNLSDMPLDMPLYRPAARNGTLKNITYSQYYDDQPGCVGTEKDPVAGTPNPRFADMTCDPLCILDGSNGSGSTDPGMDMGDANICCCNHYMVDDMGTLSKQYWNFNTGSPETVVLLNNSCIRFIYWDTDSNSPCDCQDGRKCENTGSSASPCPDSFLDRPPKAIKLILATVLDERYFPDFVRDCELNISGPLMPKSCDISKECSIDPSILKPSQYVRFEKVVYLTNLYRPVQN